MSRIDFSRVQSAEDRHFAQEQSRMRRLKAACAARIARTAPAHARENILGAALTGTLDAADQKAHAALRHWIAAMQTACREAIAAGTEPDWPVCPKAAADLAARY